MRRKNLNACPLLSGGPCIGYVVQKKLNRIHVVQTHPAEHRWDGSATSPNAGTGANMFNSSRRVGNKKNHKNDEK